MKRWLVSAVGGAALVAVAAPASLGSGTKPYGLQATRACLGGSKAPFVPVGSRVPYPEVVSELDLRLPVPAYPKPATNGRLVIVFAADPGRGAILYQRLKQLSHGLGVRTAEIRQGLILRENVVFYATTFTGMTPKFKALISGCLR